MRNIVVSLVVLIVLVLGAFWVVEVLDEEPSISFPDTVVVNIENNAELEKENLQLKSKLRYYEEKDRVVFEDGEGADLFVLVEDSSGMNLENVRVRITEKGEDTYSTFLTDLDGKAKLYNLGKECYELEFKKTGYSLKKEAVCLCNDRNLVVELE